MPTLKAVSFYFITFPQMFLFRRLINPFVVDVYTVLVCKSYTKTASRSMSVLMLCSNHQNVIMMKTPKIRDNVDTPSKFEILGTILQVFSKGKEYIL